ncbi:hypothetical protein PPERSA_02852 [Pseudocohnilembus persalinus]|uniref:Uncharacterized protein n=1 Tax=Pseudocohnilembus persalinus TaxID=266149 RepID=A0A0V0QN24_PSEPJ|nr:hypothetical protein PPERSA_02852 [Pseudocohnilembus persalinus]|eukprot:KRX03473.1 hypothetical protein PPERSA_02852 [Pseudocohnilembus persalinus]
MNRIKYKFQILLNAKFQILMKKKYIYIYIYIPQFQPNREPVALVGYQLPNNKELVDYQLETQENKPPVVLPSATATLLFFFHITEKPTLLCLLLVLIGGFVFLIVIVRNLRKNYCFDYHLN